MNVNTNIGIDELLNEALHAYASLAGLTPVEKGKSRTWSQYESSQLIDSLNESRELDPTGLTTFMMLRGLMDHFIDNAKFSAKYIINDRDSFTHELKKIHQVVQMVENPQVVELIEEFQQSLRELAKRFDVPDMAAYENLLADKYDLAHIRRDALRSIDRLEAFQFMQGKPDPNKLMVNREVFEFWNINSLVSSLRNQNLAGVSMCLIRDPEEVMASYFVFAVKNGETITILTDREEGPHPAFYRMSRRPDRTLSERATRHWFPYHLLQLEISKDGKRLFEKERTGLVPYNIDAVKLKRIGELLPEEVVWAGLVLDLINDRYGKQHRLLPETTYTGEMIVHPEALASSDSAIVRSGDYKPLEVVALKREDVTAETTAPQWERNATGFNEWIVNKFKDQVPEEILNPVGEQQRLLLENKHSKMLEKRERFGLQKDYKAVESLSPVTFGSKEKLETDRLWVARVNQCNVINKLAEDEFEKEKDGVIRWCKEHIQANKEFLLEACARGELILPEHRFGDWSDELDKTEENALAQASGKDFGYGYWSGNDAFFLGRYDNRDRAHWRCVVNDSAASIFSVIRPSCPEALAVIFGVKVDELPEGLQHWYKNEPYAGNSILDRVDPADWKIKNPWLKLKMEVAITLSKSAYNEMRKKLGLPKHQPKERKE